MTERGRWATDALFSTTYFELATAIHEKYRQPQSSHTRMCTQTERDTHTTDSTQTVVSHECPLAPAVAASDLSVESAGARAASTSSRACATCVASSSSSSSSSAYSAYPASCQALASRFRVVDAHLAPPFDLVMKNRMQPGWSRDS